MLYLRCFAWPEKRCVLPVEILFPSKKVVAVTIKKVIQGINTSMFVFSQDV